MARMLDNWHEVACVRSVARRSFADERDSGLALFSASEMPELAHPLVVDLGDRVRDHLLTQRLYHHLQFTVNLESRVVNRALERIANNRLDLRLPDRVRLDAFKIYTDEAYHALSNLDLLQQVRAVTGVAPCPYTFEGVLSALDQPLAHTPPRGAGLDQLLQAVVFETVVTTLLDAVPRDPTVSTTVRSAIGDHAADERTHHAFFTRLFPEIWSQLTPRTKAAAAVYLPQVVRACLEPDLTYARLTLRSAGLTPEDADCVLAETYRDDITTANIRHTSRHTLALFRTTGVLDVPGAEEAFARAGLTGAPERRQLSYSALDPEQGAP